jgi:flagellar assembly protein FliH
MRSLSNLIKSGRVIDIGTPVNIGVSYTVNEANHIILEKSNKIIKHGVKKEEITSNIQMSDEKILESEVNESIQEEILSQEEIMAKYMKEAQEQAKLFYENEMRKAYEEGVIKAQEEATRIIEQAKIDYEKILEEVNQLKENAINEYKNEIKSNESNIVDLALDIAEKIINYEVNRSDEYILSVVEDAVNRVLNKKDVTVKLSTQDYYIVQANKKILNARVKGFGEIELVLEESLDVGSCIVDTPLGVIDGSLQVRMDNIQNEIRKLLDE